MEESGFKKIAYNCKKVTFLIEKKQIGNISMREKLELKIHLACCSACRIFERQSILINKLVHDLFHEPRVTSEIKLDDDFQKKVQDQIMEKLEKVKCHIGEADSRFYSNKGIRASKNRQFYFPRAVKKVLHGIKKFGPTLNFLGRPNGKIICGKIIQNG